MALPLAQSRLTVVAVPNIPVLQLVLHLDPWLLQPGRLLDKSASQMRTQSSLAVGCVDVALPRDAPALWD